MRPEVIHVRHSREGIFRGNICNFKRGIRPSGLIPSVLRSEVYELAYTVTNRYAESRRLSIRLPSRFRFRAFSR